MSKAFKQSIDDKGIATLCFDLESEKVNKFSSDVMLEFESHLDELKKDSSIKLLVITSAKKGIFIAGADIRELQRFQNRSIALEKAKKGQDVFNKLKSLPFPTLAVINGACMGGGMECALACDYRLATTNPKTQLALPEVNLGILPGWGGTQRLPRLVGLTQSLTMILTGKPVNGSKALRSGLINKLVAHEFLEDELPKYLDELLKSGKKTKENFKPKGWMNKLLEKTPIGRGLIFKKSKNNVLKKSKGQYPAPLEALQVIENTYHHSLEEGLKAEREAFSRLSDSPICKSLIQLFFNNEDLKKNPGCELDLHQAKSIEQSSVLGAGIMGGGIAWLFAHKGIPARLKDLNWDAISKGYQAASKMFLVLKKIRKINSKEMSVKMSRLSSGIDYKGFKKMDMVVEAIVENIDIKKKALSELETEVRDDTILCSNTSALSINEMAEVLNRPERFIGMHFFNPVNRMPLVEVIPGKQTSEETLATTVKLVQSLGKTAIVVQDCPGFLVNRILLPFMNEAARILQEGGAGAEKIDQLILQFGMPMGPFHLADEVGIDVGYHVAATLEQAYGERMKVAAVLEYIFKDKKWLGKKASKGFYIYKGKEKELNSELLKCVQQTQKKYDIGNKTCSDDDIVHRCILTMVNEAVKCLEEGVVAQASQLDMAMIMGTGFPPFRGGLLYYADSIGIQNVVNILNRFQDQYGQHFEPAQRLIEMSQSSSCFYPELNEE